jgi:2-polyprenyl-6-methoxyphenol hydroxylase-like FAD-dependent oxidoreductase
MGSRLGERAIVIGGSMAGLMTARVLADHFEQVTVLERDHIEDHPAIHKSIPQGNHLHALLLGGQQVMERLYPGFADRLHAMGAVRLRVGMDNAIYGPTGKAYSLGGAVKEPRDLGIDFHCQSRGLLEHCVRQCTLESANVSFQGDCTVEKLIDDKARVCGVVYGQDGGSHSLSADLVVDAGGRGSHAPRWLKDFGFPTPEETSIGVDFAYASTKYRIPNYSEPEKLLFAIAPGPNYPKAGIMEQIEGGVFHLSLGGRFGDYPPADEAGFLAFTKSLHTPKFYDLIKDAERVAEITTHRFPNSLRRHYERLATFPEGFLVLGDAISSFNPVYGQGMSSAALQVAALQKILKERAEGTGRLEGMAPVFFAKAAEVVMAPWTLAASFDFAFPQTKGERPRDFEQGAKYFGALEALMAEDQNVQLLVTEVFSLTRPLAALWSESLRGRVMEQVKKMEAAQ